MITLYYLRKPLYIYPALASELGYKQGDHLQSHAEFYRVVHLNAKQYAARKS